MEELKSENSKLDSEVKRLEERLALFSRKSPEEQSIKTNLSEQNEKIGYLLEKLNKKNN
jgi:predicted RNase H-like nuclease (RuvC/YqgF family)